jgi:hypothetical protein
VPALGEHTALVRAEFGHAREKRAV